MPAPRLDYSYLRTPLASHNGRPLASPQLQEKQQPQKLNTSYYFQPITRADAFDEASEQTQRAQEEMAVDESIFRIKVTGEDNDLDSMWMLKRANPIGDTEEAAFCGSPTKRTRTLDEDDRLDPSQPFVLRYQE